MDQNSFFFQALIYLGSAVLFVPIAKRLGLGSVLGYLIGGIVIGPSVTGFIGQGGQDILHFSEFGVVLMLFLIGLELEPPLLWKMRKPILGLGGLQVLITSLAISIAGILCGLTWQSSLALGMILSLSSTAIVMQILGEKGLVKTAAGQNAFAVLLFQDIAVIPMLAMFPLLAIYHPYHTVSGTHGSGNWVAGKPGWLQTLIVLGSVAGIIVAGRYIVRPLLRIVADTRLRELFTASALLLVIGIAVLMTQVGLSPALGTFLAGVVLASSEYKHELESDIEPFKGLLLGLFFIAVGASINFELILMRPLLIFGLVLGLMLLKTFILAMLGKVFRIEPGRRLLFSVALSQAGEFAFVLFSFSLQENILEPGLVNIMIAVVAVSMALTPLAILINDKIIQPWLCAAGNEDIKADEIGEKHPVIIAGFGHFGSTIGRFLRAHTINATFLDIDAERVNLLRKMGFNVYYGDASRYDLLESAGAANAQLIVIAIDPPEKRLEMIDTVKKHFPNLRMLVRARNRYDAYDQMNAGMLHIYRESLDTSLRVGVDVMTLLGYPKEVAEKAAGTFYKYDEQNLKKLSSIRDKDEYISTARGFMEELEQILQNDLHSMEAGKKEAQQPNDV